MISRVPWFWRFLFLGVVIKHITTELLAMDTSEEARQLQIKLDESLERSRRHEEEMVLLRAEETRAAKEAYYWHDLVMMERRWGKKILEV